MKKFNFKVITATFICCTFLLTTSAFGFSSSSLKAAASKKTPVKLTFATFNTWWTTDNLKVAIKLFQEETGNIIDPQIYPDDQFTNIIKTKLATGDVPDLFEYNTSVKDFAPDQLDALQGLWTKKIDLKRAAINGYARVGDKNIYAAPFGPCGFQGMMYNKDVMKKAGVKLPLKTYKEFVAACIAIKKIGVTPLYLPNKDGWTAQIVVYTGSMYIPIKSPFFTRKIYTNKMQYKNEPLMVDMLKRLVDLKTKGYMNTDMASATMAMAEQALAEGKVAMVGGGNWLYADFQKNYADKASSISMTAVNWGDDASTLGVMKSGSGSGLYIPTASKNKTAAREFINFVMSDKVMKAMYEAVPGANDVGVKTKASPWDADMQGLIDNKLAINLDPFMNAIANLKPGSGFEVGDMGSFGQSLFAGKDITKVLEDLYSDGAKKNKAKGIPGFK